MVYNFLSELDRNGRLLRKNLMNKAGVVGVGVGYKKVKGRKTKKLSIVCSVREKKEKLSMDNMIPKTINGLNTDVIQTGEFTIFKDPKKRYRPAPGGVSAGHYLITAGTLGCWLKQDGNYVMLSNNHVLANSNEASIGDEILQPGTYDGGDYTDVIGYLSDYQKIYFEGENGDSWCPLANSVTGLLNVLSSLFGRQTRFNAVIPSTEKNYFDAAIAEPTQASDVDPEIMNIGEINGVRAAHLGDKIQKMGRTTDLTNGKIDQIGATVQVSYGQNKTAIFENQMVAGAMSAGGDSGSAVLDTDNNLVGLLFAGSETTTIISRINPILERFNLT